MSWRLKGLLYLPGVLASAFLLLFSFCLAAAQSSLSAEESFIRDMERVTVLPPEDPPRLHQESIDLALTMFNIKVPENAHHPKLDFNVADRGLTTLNGSGKLEITVGPSAFSSWGLLGSTLAHELEVHAQQNFTMIRLLDLSGLEGTKKAEREAYLHELKHANRFFLSSDDRLSIAQTMDYFYPEDRPERSLASRLSQSVGQWLAKPFPE